jgi:hypothetical protein
MPSTRLDSSLPHTLTAGTGPGSGAAHKVGNTTRNARDTLARREIQDAKSSGHE